MKFNQKSSVTEIDYIFLPFFPKIAFWAKTFNFNKKKALETLFIENFMRVNNQVN